MRTSSAHCVYEAHERDSGREAAGGGTAGEWGADVLGRDHEGVDAVRAAVQARAGDEGTARCCDRRRFLPWLSGGASLPPPLSEDAGWSVEEKRSGSRAPAAEEECKAWFSLTRISGSRSREVF